MRLFTANIYAVFSLFASTKNAFKLNGKIWKISFSDKHTNTQENKYFSQKNTKKSK